MSERRYNEAELAAILRTAAESQSLEANESNEAGYSLGDIERLASEVGIDPKHIVVAAQNLPAETPTKRQFRFWGAPARQNFERTIRGSFDDLTWEEAVAELRKTFGTAGTVSTVGTSREWTGEMTSGMLTCPRLLAMAARKYLSQFTKRIHWPSLGWSEES